MRKLLSVLLTVSMLILCCFAPACAEADNSGNIFLYGESHADPACLEKELAAWSDCYAGGMRDLFIELPFYSAEYLNRWMHADTDELLELVYNAMEGTQMHAPCVLGFYRSIKSGFPDTVFHGTDVGHQFSTLGTAYLALLESEGRKDSDHYRLTEEIIDQGRTYYTMKTDNKDAAYVYREKLMVDNFLRVYDALGQKDIMGIYGSAHTNLFSLDSTGSIPCMASQLKDLLGNRIYSTDLTKSGIVRSDTVTLNGKQYEASYFGSSDISSWSPDFLKRDFWRVEGAYEDLKDAPVAGDCLPAGNYIMEIGPGQVFIVEYTKKDGSLLRLYYIADGSKTSSGVLNTYGIIVSE